MSAPYQYIVLKESNQRGVLACQAAHAAGESILLPHDRSYDPGGIHVVMLVAKCSDDLEVLGGVLEAEDIPHVVIREPDPPCRVTKAGEPVRNMARRFLFARMTGHPVKRPGFIVDHIVPLKCGGCDVPSNMQWLTVDEWRAKTKWERHPCASWFDGENERRRKGGSDASPGLVDGPSVERVRQESTTDESHTCVPNAERVAAPVGHHLLVRADPSRRRGITPRCEPSLK